MRDRCLLLVEPVRFKEHLPLRDGALIVLVHLEGVWDLLDELIVECAKHLLHLLQEDSELDDVGAAAFGT